LTLTKYNRKNPKKVGLGGLYSSSNFLRKKKGGGTLEKGGKVDTRFKRIFGEVRKRRGGKGGSPPNSAA